MAIGGSLGFASSKERREERRKTASLAPIALMVVVVVVLIATGKGPVLLRVKALVDSVQRSNQKTRL